jgi:hypothetical protein
MPGLETIGRWLIIAGLAIVFFGGIVWLVARLFPNLSQFPGTLRIQGGGMTCVFPILASIIASIVLTILLNVIARLMNK